MGFEHLADEENQLALERHERRIRRCRTCQAKIIFLETALGKKMPVDADTVEIADEMFDSSRHTSHFAVCPGADKHRRPR